MAPDAFWSLTTREFMALADMHQQPILRWAIERVWYAEAHRDPDKDSMPWEVDDFLVSGHREARRIEHDAMRRAVAAENKRLMQIKRGPPTDDIPMWARGDRGRKLVPEQPKIERGA